MTTPRPICAHCGKPYGQRHAESHQIRWPVGEDMPRYQGNGIMVKVGNTYTTTNRETVRKLTMMSPNQSHRAYQEEELARTPEKSENTVTIWTWDGETWRGGYKPFCTMRCALDYARKAFKKHGAVK